MMMLRMLLRRARKRMTMRKRKRRLQRWRMMMLGRMIRMVMSDDGDDDDDEDGDGDGDGDGDHDDDDDDADDDVEDDDVEDAEVQEDNVDNDDVEEDEDEDDDFDEDDDENDIMRKMKWRRTRWMMMMIYDDVEKRGEHDVEDGDVLEDDEKDNNVAEDEVEEDDVAEDQVEDDGVEDDDVKGEADDSENDDVEEEDRSQDRGPHFVRDCAIEMHLDMSEEPLQTEIHRKNSAAQIGPRTRTHTLCEPARPKFMSACHRRHRIRATLDVNLEEKIRGPDWAQNADTHTLREPTHVKISQEPLDSYGNFHNICRRPKPRRRLCASLRTRNACQDFTGATLSQKNTG